MTPPRLTLSRLLLDPRHPDVQRDLASPYELHRTLSRAFPDTEGPHRQSHGVLFRVEDPTPRGVPILVQSTTAPDWRHLPDGYTRADGPKPFEPEFVEGQRLRFRLVANPVRRVAAEGKKHPRREPLVHPLPDPDSGRPDGYLPWLLRQADRHGFALPTVDGEHGPEAQVLHLPFRTAPRRANGEPIPKACVSHFGVRFDGTLTVTDPDALRSALHDGVGPAKAFGFGLLSLAPV